jgi:hypothetical protein
LQPIVLLCHWSTPSIIHRGSEHSVVCCTGAPQSGHKVFKEWTHAPTRQTLPDGAKPGVSTLREAPGLLKPLWLTPAGVLKACNLFHLPSIGMASAGKSWRVEACGNAVKAVSAHDRARAKRGEGNMQPAQHLGTRERTFEKPRPAQFSKPSQQN